MCFFAKVSDSKVFSQLSKALFNDVNDEYCEETVSMFAHHSIYLHEKHAIQQDKGVVKTAEHQSVKIRIRFHIVLHNLQLFDGYWINSIGRSLE